METERYRNLLEARLDELEHRLAEGEEGAKPVELDQSRVGRLSRIDALQGQALNAEAQRRRQVELVKVRAALERIRDGVFGECAECGEFIAARRLEHDPACSLCIECAERAER